LKKLLFILVPFFVLLFSCKANKADKYIFNHNDSVTISIDSIKCKYSNQDFQSILRNFPSLQDEKKYIVKPDKAYEQYMSSPFTYSFGSEAGEDEFCIFYTYLLRNKIKNNNIEKRDLLIKLYRKINEFHHVLSFGGTFYGHQYIRLVAYAEYSSRYYEPMDYYDDFTFHHNRYFKHLYDLVGNTLKELPESEKEGMEEKLKSLIAEIRKLTMERYYFHCAVNFNASFYGSVSLD